MRKRHKHRKSRSRRHDFTIIAVKLKGSTSRYNSLTNEKMVSTYGDIMFTSLIEEDTKLLF